jgi:FixJ family two-component response regulator
MNKPATLIAVIDDDESVRESLPALLNEFGFASKTFSTAEEFLEFGLADQPQCLILDIAMPGMSGPQLRRELLRRGYTIPTIFISAHFEFASQPDVREGAVDCLTKPFGESALLDALKRALNLP